MQKSRLQRPTQMVFDVNEEDCIDLWFTDALSAHYARKELIDAGIFDFDDYSTHCFLKSAIGQERGWRIFDQDIAFLAKLKVGHNTIKIDSDLD